MDMDSEQEGTLIPGLPDDMALLCLCRIPRVHHLVLSRVSRSWQELFRSYQLFSMRSKMQCEDTQLLVLNVCDTMCFFAYDLKSKLRRRLPLLDDEERVEHWLSGGFKCATLGSSLVVLGGVVRDYVGLHGQPAVNIFDSLTECWSQGADMQVARCYFACCVINGRLFVAGGYNENGEVETSGEVYDYKTNSWSFIAPMPFGLANIESDAVFNGRLFIKGRSMCGAHDERKVLSYEPGTNTWEVNQKLETRLLDGEFLATDDGLYIMNRSNYIGLYDEGAAEWQQVGNISLYFFPFDCAKPASISFGKEVFFLNNLVGECMDLHKCTAVHQVLPKVFWQWQGALIRA